MRKHQRSINKKDRLLVNIDVKVGEWIRKEANNQNLSISNYLSQILINYYDNKMLN